MISSKSTNESFSDSRLASSKNAQLTDVSMSNSKNSCDAEAGKLRSGFNWSFWIAFTVATIAITEFFTSYRFFKAQNEVLGYVWIAASILILALSLFVCAFEVYADEKDKDNLRVSFKPFDFIYTKFRGLQG